MADTYTEPETAAPAHGNGFEESRRAAPGRRPRAKWILMGVAIALAIAGLVAWRYYSVRESTDDAQIEAHIAPVSSRVSGTVTTVLVDNNQYVEAGTVLVQLDPSDYQVGVERARAELADAQASARAAHTNVPITSVSSSTGLNAAEANLAAARKEADAARARLQQAEAQNTKAAADLERAQKLIAQDEIPQQQYDSAVAAAHTAKAAVEAAQAAVAAAESRVAQAGSQVRAASTAPEQVAVTRARAGAASAAAEKSEANLRQAELDLQYTTIKAPVSGYVSKRSVEPGQVVQPGQPLLAIVPLSNIWVVANFKETQLKNMRVGQPATIHVDAYDRDYRGHVDSFGGATAAKFSLLPPENATGNYVKVVQRVPVKIVFEKGQDPEHLLRPGMSVVPTVITR